MHPMLLRAKDPAKKETLRGVLKRGLNNHKNRISRHPKGIKGYWERANAGHYPQE